jgi:DNA-binding transcriptional ArsR family regulator
MSSALDALGNPVRRQILRLLQEQPRPVGELREALDVDISRPAVSKHLRILEAAELVSHESRGTRNIYRLEATGFEAARAGLDSFWDEALGRFKLLAENTSPRRKRSKKKGRK